MNHQQQCAPSPSVILKSDLFFGHSKVPSLAFSFQER